MKNSIRTFISFSIISIFPIISFAQNSDSIDNHIVKSNFATLYVYHPQNGFIGSLGVHLGDSLLCRSNYNSKHEIILYKEGKTELWVKPKNESSLTIDVKFGEKYFLKCLLLPAGKTTQMKIELVDSVKGKREYCEIKNRDSDRKSVV